MSAPIYQDEIDSARNLHTSLMELRTNVEACAGQYYKQIEKMRDKPPYDWRLPYFRALHLTMFDLQADLVAAAHETLAYYGRLQAEGAREGREPNSRGKEPS